MSHSDKAKIVSRGAEVSTMHHQGHPVTHPDNQHCGWKTSGHVSRSIAKSADERTKHKTGSSPLVGKTQVVGHQSQVVGHQSQVVGHQSRVVGHQSQVVGQPTQVVGHSSQVVGHPAQGHVVGQTSQYQVTEVVSHSTPHTVTEVTEVVTHSAPQVVTEVVTHSAPQVVTEVTHSDARQVVGQVAQHQVTEVHSSPSVVTETVTHGSRSVQPGVTHGVTHTTHATKRRSSSSSSSSKATGRLVTNRTYYDDRVLVIPKKETVRERSMKSMPVKKKIIEVEKAYEVEEIVEIPEIEVIEEIEEREVKQIVNRTIEKPVEEVVDVIKEVPIEQIEEVVVEVPEVRYNDIILEKVVEVPTTKEVVKTREKPVTQYRDVITTVEKDVHQSRNVTRKIPVPVEARIVQHFTVPNLKKKYKTHKYEAIIPEFQEYAVHRSAVVPQGLTLLNEIHETLSQPSVGLCHLETIYQDIKSSEFLEEPTFVPKHRILQDIITQVPHLANVHNVHYREVALEDLSCSVRSKGTTRTPLPSRGKVPGKKGACC